MAFVASLPPQATQGLNSSFALSTIIACCLECALDSESRTLNCEHDQTKSDDDKEAIYKVVASLTPGLVGADLENIVRESVLAAEEVSNGISYVGHDAIDLQIDR
ncbi:hypothetical protein L1987_30274 [Smallanthus sonchifolius]|uniref:Uncharacterized protein n=1 Tax=Smallanthus sonchifolius TaxID=185202 RepID=A0ACB9I260_9ASTR|nr:hypothetical protein L1987_30274 [Smallanthus sonchifolius]